MEEKISILLDRTKDIQNSFNQLDKDLESDRQDLAQIRIILETLTAQIDELRKQIKSNIEKTQNKVSEAIAPVIEETQDLKESINNLPDNLPKDKTLLLKETMIKKQSWAKRLKYWWLRG